MFTHYHNNAATVLAAQLTKENHLQLAEITGGLARGGSPHGAAEKIVLNPGTGDEGIARLGDWIVKLEAFDGKTIWDAVAPEVFPIVYNPSGYTGSDACQTERLRQLGRGHDAAHDDALDLGTLEAAAHCYLQAGWAMVAGEDTAALSMSRDWPFEDQYWKPATSAKRNLEKAMALIAAAWDRLDRAEKKAPTSPIE